MKKKLIAIICLCSLMLCSCATETDESIAESSGEEIDVTVDETTTETAVQETEEPSESTTTTSETTEITTEVVETTVAVDYLELYRPVLDSAYRMLIDGPGDEIPVGENGLWEMRSEGLEAVGYTFRDLNNDGIDELIIGGFFILDIYTLANDEPVLVQEGWFRSSLYLLSDGRIYNHGSNGAAYAVIRTYDFLPNSTELSVLDLYYTSENDTYDGFRYFHNTTGVYSMEFPAEEEISESEYSEALSAIEEMVIEIEYTPFSQYEYVG